jgi:hypothetical protein
MKMYLASCAAVFLLMTGVSFAQNEDEQGQNEQHGRVHEINPYQNSRNTSLTAGSTGAITPKINYAGGALIPAPTIYYIFYGNWAQSNGTDTSAAVTLLEDFAQHIGGSPYFAINTSYGVPAYPISGSVAYGGKTTDAYSRGKRLRDSDILKVVTAALSIGKFKSDPTGVYFVLTSSDVTETSGFCTQYCGWHTAGSSTVGHLRYSFVGNAARCISACAAQSVGPNGNAGVDGMISVISHELEETTTDADPRSGWTDSSGAENGDKCAWTFGQNQTLLPNGAYSNVQLGSKNYLIQRNLKQIDTGDTCNMSLTTQ